LVDYIKPKDAGARNGVVQTFALLLAGAVGIIGGIVGILNLQTSRRNLQQQHELEEQRAQEDALQSYFEQMGDLLTNHNLIKTDREDIRQLAQGQTLTVLARLDQRRQGSLARFLHGAGLIRRGKAIISLRGAILVGVDLYYADLNHADLSGTFLINAGLTHATLSRADLSDAYLTDAELIDTDLRQADLRNADLAGADLRDAQGVTNEELEQQAYSLEGVTLPNGQKYEDWLKSKGRGEDG